MRKPNYMKYCPEHYTEIENYELAKADNFKGWICHHRNGVEFSEEWLKNNNMYYNRSDPHEFKFLTYQEHSLLHNRIHHTGHKRSVGKLNPMYGKKGKDNPNYGSHRSEESKARMRANHPHSHTCLGMKWRLEDGKRKYYKPKDC